MCTLILRRNTGVCSISLFELYPFSNHHGNDSNPHYLRYGQGLRDGIHLWFPDWITVRLNSTLASSNRPHGGAD